MASNRTKMWRRLTLRTSEGVYLDRWGIRIPRLGAVLLHRMAAPDPGNELHDHPWAFLTIPLWGGYIERRADAQHARDDHCFILFNRSMRWETRRPFRPRRMRLSEAHSVTALRRRTSWSLVFTGPLRRDWGFYTRSQGWVDHEVYESTEEGRSRDMKWDSNYKGSGQSDAHRSHMQCPAHCGNTKLKITGSTYHCPSCGAHGEIMVYEP